MNILPSAFCFLFCKELNTNNEIMPSTKRYKCTICGHVYDSLMGDPDSGIAPGTSFNDIPDDWVCPICGVGKSEYIPIG